MFAFQAKSPGSNQTIMASHRSVFMGRRLIAEPNGLEACLSTFTIGCLGFQVFTSDLSGPREPESLVLPSWLQPILIPIWPVVSPRAVWPGNGPLGVVVPGVLDTLVTWGSTFQDRAPKTP